ncbi:retron St85 family effector protein [Hyphomonas pacifica]|uniref:retron St85 family effector protein n=1 Tax=Hyphomonas pacifica TaxID=1280941 RepID=UPI000DBF5760|nr:retron St85 family effector protein [Hyphomonas pacifica]RAN37015.1 hypothetical protein HY11_10430 [Hyphomonas pacifica]
MNLQASQFLEKVRLGDCRIQYPEDVVFLCGGQMNDNRTSFSSLRDVINKKAKDIFEDKQVLLAERVATAFDARLFDDLLELEAHIASISRLVLLVSESAGSIAELGAFSQIEEIRENLLVYIHSQHFQENSFIRDGPIRYLLNKDEQSVQEFNWLKTSRGGVHKKSAEKISAPIKSSIKQFLGKLPRTGKFQDNRIGHDILLVAGIVQLLRCSKIREIRNALTILGREKDEKKVKQILFCLTLFGWVRPIKRETQYYVYLCETDPFLFRGRGVYSEFDPIRVRYDILSGYPQEDPRLAILDSLEQ